MTFRMFFGWVKTAMLALIALAGAANVVDTVEFGYRTENQREDATAEEED